MYNNVQAALIHLGHMAKDTVEPFPPLSLRDTRRKETHLHRVKGDSRLFDGTAWYLQSRATISRAATHPAVSPNDREQGSEDEDPKLLAGTQTLKRADYTKSARTPNGSVALDSDAEMTPSRRAAGGRKKKKKKAKKGDGWIWLESWTRAATTGDDAKLAEYKAESARVQWFRAEAEMYRWLEQYERKHAELWHVIERFGRDSAVWAGLADREQKKKGVHGAVSFARMQAAMYRQLQHNTRVIFKSAESGAHADWVSATTFDELVTKIDAWCVLVFKWMDELGIHRVYRNL
ncbi:hypothetical protein B0H10DRAFT_2208147 [Mycena sp. CBHHK59/15]|nr:hypothetical protein B0H10DRAFT_2208147 [Mycena sp. CBHHK59/15]